LVGVEKNSESHHCFYLIGECLEKHIVGGFQNSIVAYKSRVNLADNFMENTSKLYSSSVKLRSASALAIHSADSGFIQYLAACYDIGNKRVVTG
jgi:hypothetical protein